MTDRLRSMLTFAGLVVGGLALAAAYAVLPLAGTMPSSPDEASNLFFAERFAENGALWSFEPLELTAPGLVHPRSVRVAEEMLVPGGFIGLPVIYGGFAALLGTAIIPFLTAIVAALGVFAWYGVARAIFGRRMGLYAAILLAAHPAWWYAASRPLLPNALFATLVLGALFLGIASPFKDMVERSGTDRARLLRHADPVIAGILLALAIAVRPSEVYWLAIAGVIAAWPLLKDLTGRVRLATFVMAGVLTLLPFLMFQYSTYGDIFASGYGHGTDVLIEGALQGRGNALLGPLRPYLFPLGFAPMNAIRNGITYGLAFFPWWTALVMGGLFFAARGLKTATPAAKRFTTAAVALSAWLVLFYGSWVVQDNPDPKAVTIGSSYLRYWLPIFIASTVPVAFLFDRLAERAKGVSRKIVMGALLVAYVAAGALTVVLSPGEGLRALILTDRRYQAVVRDVLEIVPENALIVADRADKYFFGRRAVMSPLRADSTYDALPKLLAKTKVYYFGITFPETDLAYLRGTILAPRGVTIEPVRAFDHETLYVFSLTP